MAINLKVLAESPGAFRDAIVIDTGSSAAPLGTVLDPWQRADFEVLDPGWLRVAGRGRRTDSTLLRAWLERPRGHSKTSDQAVMATYALFASVRKLSGIACAADVEQAGLLRDAIARLVQLNPWLAQLLDVQRSRIVNTRTQSELRIITSDAPSSYGLTPDFAIVDEVTHWGSRDLWDSVLSSCAKRADNMLVAISNAGFNPSWQFDLREVIRTSDGWHFNALDGPQASWINAKALDEQRRFLPPVAFDRLWLNRWSSGSGDALPDADILAAVCREPRSAPVAGCRLVCGLDLGLSRDSSALAIVERSSDGERNRVLNCEAWTPSPGSRVSIEEIEHRIIELHAATPIELLAFDPWQASYLAERLQKIGIDTLAVPFTAKNLQSMATTTIEAFSERRIELPNDPALLHDLRRLRVVERSFGFRLDCVRDKTGHGDRATALAIALHAAGQLPPQSFCFDADLKSIPKLRDILGPEFAHLVDELDADDPWPPTTGRVIRIGDGW